MTDNYLKNMLGENEQIIFVTRQHWLVLLGQILAKSVLALGLAILITLIWRIWLPQSLVVPWPTSCSSCPYWACCGMLSSGRAGNISSPTGE